MPKKIRAGVSETRRRIVSAVRDLLMMDGYDAVQPAAVALRAGVTKKDLNAVFKTRESLVEGALDFHWAEIKPVVEQVFSPDLPPLERFRRFFSGAVEFQKYQEARVGCIVGCLFLRVGSSVPIAEKRLRRSMNDRIAELQRHMERAIRDAQSEGLIRKGDPSAKAWTVVHYLEGMLGIARIDGNLNALDGAWQRVLEFLGAEAPQAGQFA
jgi:TetR/AcrR family transcriptional repressor of nem operon